MVAIAIDGPAAAGKSTIAKAVARELGYLYVDTGALYRAIGLFAIRRGIAPSDAQALIPHLNELDLALEYRNDEQCVLLDGEDVSEQIRRPEMGMAASAVAAIPEVRARLLDLQRTFAERHSVVMDGRDIGTMVLPHADIKIYLTAAAQARACRRYREHLAKGQKVLYNDILADIEKRDYNDAHRVLSPLRQAEDAVLIDTSECTLAQSVEMILDKIKDGMRL